jgi:uncharacterized membrane protein YedE/YeeE
MRRASDHPGSCSAFALAASAAATWFAMLMPWRFRRICRRSWALVGGGFISGAFSKRLKLQVEKSPAISNRKRLLFAFAGGLLFVYGAQLARGCTSGAALSGMAVLSVAGFVTMAAIFGSAFLFAYIFRKNWI